MPRLAQSLCLHAAIIAVSGAMLGIAAPAQTQQDPRLQSLLSPSSAAPSGRPTAPSANGSASARVATPQGLSPEELGDILVIHHRYQAAITAYSSAPQMTAILWAKLGVAYQMLFDDEDAIRCYQQALQLDPGYADALNDLATIHESQGLFGEAEREYRAALKLAPGSAMIRKNLGTDLMVEHKYNQGWEAYQQALAIDPEIFAGPNGPHIGNIATKEGLGAVDYYTALANLRAGYTDAAIESLRAAMNEGFMTPKKVSRDKNVAPLRQDPAFQQLLADESLH